MLRAVEYTDIRITLTKQRILLCNAEQDLFTPSLVDSISVAEYYYGSPVYFELSFGGSRFETFGKNIMKVAIETFLKCANRFWRRPRTGT